MSITGSSLEDDECETSDDESANSSGDDSDLSGDASLSDESADDFASLSSESSEAFPLQSSTDSAGCGVALYPGSCVTDDSFGIVFFSLAQRHNLTYSSQSHILKFVSLLLPSPNRIPSTSHVLTRKYVNFKEDTIVQHYCGFCSSPIESGSTCG